MYPRNAASPPRIAIGAVVQISDGAVQTSGITITVRGEGGAEGTGGGTTDVGASGIVYYTPTQAETNFTAFVVIASKASCWPVSQTIVTTASPTAGQVVVATNNDKTGYSLTAGTGLGNQTANITGNLSGSVGSVTSGVTVTTNNDKTGYALSSTGMDSVVLPASLITASSIAAGALNGKGNWNIGKTGYDLSSTGLDAIAQSSTGMVEIAKAVWDRVLNGATHNIASSAGRRLRTVPQVELNSGTAQAGSSNTITLAASASSQDDFYVPGLVVTLSGTGALQARRSTAYNGTSKVLTVATNWVTNPANDTEYQVIPWASVRVSEMDGNVITADAVAPDAVTEIQSGLSTAAELAKVPKSDGTASWNATALAAINAECDTALADYDAPTKTEMDAAFTEIKGATWATTDTLEAIRDRGDAAWTTATGFSTHSAADVWSVATRVLTANTNLNDPTAAAIADAVWDEAIADHLGAGSTGAALNAAGAAGDPWTTALPGSYTGSQAGKMLSDILTDTAEIGAAGAGLTEAGGTGDHLTAVPWNANWDAEVQSECADALGAFSWSGITVGTVTTLTNLPAIPGNWLTAAGIAANALDGKGNWNVGKTGYTLTAGTGLGNQTADITGNLSGSVGSVTGAVGSVTGNVGGSVGSVTGAVGSVTGNVGGSVGSLATQAKADVNAEVVDALATDTYAEPAAVVPATSSLKDKINWVFALLRNQRTQTNTTETLFADDATTPVATSSKSDNGTTATRGEWT